MSIGRQMDKEDVRYRSRSRSRSRYTHTSWNIIQPQEKNEILPFAIIWITLDDIMLSETSLKDKPDFTYM